MTSLLILMRFLYLASYHFIKIFLLYFIFVKIHFEWQRKFIFFSRSHFFFSSFFYFFFFNFFKKTICMISTDPKASPSLNNMLNFIPASAVSVIRPECWWQAIESAGSDIPRDSMSFRIVHSVEKGIVFYLFAFYSC